MKSRLYLLVWIILLCSCARNSNVTTTNDTGSIISIDLFSEPESELTLLSDVATELDYIPLQTTENSLVGSITKIITCNGKFYIKNSFNEILCFDQEGQYINKLNKVGRGPEEYTFITDFDVSSDNKSLFILSSGRILIYNNISEIFIFDKSINLDRPFPSKISLIPGTTNILLSIDPTTGTEPSLSIVINTQGDTVLHKPNCYLFEKVDKHNWSMINESLHYDNGNSICFKEEFSDTVFSIDKELKQFYPKLIFDSHGKGFPPRVRYDSEYAKLHGTELYWVYSILETERYIFYTYEHNKSRNKILYDKSEKRKFKIGLKDAFIDDINGGPLLDPNFCSEGKVYSFVEALTLKNYIKGQDFINFQVKSSIKKEELYKTAESLNESDNPVLIVMTLKK